MCSMLPIRTPFRRRVKGLGFRCKRAISGLVSPLERDSVDGGRPRLARPQALRPSCQSV